MSARKGCARHRDLRLRLPREKAQAITSPSQTCVPARGASTCGTLPQGGALPRHPSPGLRLREGLLGGQASAGGDLTEAGCGGAGPGTSLARSAPHCTESGKRGEGPSASPSKSDNLAPSPRENPKPVELTWDKCELWNNWRPKNESTDTPSAWTQEQDTSPWFTQPRDGGACVPRPRLKGGQAVPGQPGRAPSHPQPRDGPGSPAGRQHPPAGPRLNHHCLAAPLMRDLHWAAQPEQKRHGKGHKHKQTSSRPAGEGC